MRVRLPSGSAVMVALHMGVATRPKGFSQVRVLGVFLDRKGADESTAFGKPFGSAGAAMCHSWQRMKDS